MHYRALIVGLSAMAIVSAVGACSFEFELEDRTYKCGADRSQPNAECLEEEGFTCNLELEVPVCERKLEDPSEGEAECTDADLDDFYAGPLPCRRCPPETPDCPEDKDDDDDTVYPGAAERCDGKDNDQDGVIDQEDDDYQATKCRLQIGACLGAVRPCGGPAGPLDCDDEVYRANNEDYSPDEQCADGIDNNCDTETDPPRDCECLDGQTEECRSEAFGVCAEVIGLRTCAGGQWGACEGAAEPSPEICDGLDNNCNGRLDEHPDDADVSVCGECPWNMVFVLLGEERWCVDRWEASKDPDSPARPTSAPNAQPWMDISFNEVTAACALAPAGQSLGAKAVCPITVWTQACKTEGNAAYPYGNEFQPENCNGNSAGVEATGARNGCISAWPDRPGAAGSGQIFDMSGNAAEWVRPPPNDLTQKLVYGGSYLSQGDPLGLSCEGREDRQGNVAGQPYVGFRCCKQLDE